MQQVQQHENAEHLQHVTAMAADTWSVRSVPNDTLLARLKDCQRSGLKIAAKVLADEARHRKLIR
jgi:hypothetical protein